MANSRSARKRIRANQRKHIRNRGVRSSVRTYVGKARQSLLTLEPGDIVDVEEQLKAAVRALDRAGEKGILHRNNVNRRKSRLTAMAARLIARRLRGGRARHRVARRCGRRRQGSGPSGHHDEEAGSKGALQGRVEAGAQGGGDREVRGRLQGRRG